MTEDWLPALDPLTVTRAARQCLNLPDAEISDWWAEPLRHEKTIETTGGLFCVRGLARSGTQTLPWSAVLKLIHHPPDPDSEVPQGMGYWRRELLAYQSGMLAALPSAVRAPRCYGVSEDAQRGWLWLEDIEETAPVWTLAHYAQAARGWGQWAGAALLGRFTPRYDWLCASLFRDFYAADGWWQRFLDPASANNAWQRPLVQAVYDDPLRARVLRIWQEKARWLTAYERLPQVFCHHDAHRRNLMRLDPAAQTAALSPDAALAAIDWGFCGPGALGSDLGQLIGTSLSYFAVDPSQAAELESAVLAGYTAGLRDAGWQGDERLARLGYLISLTLYWGGTLPSEIASLQPGQSHINVQAKYNRPLPDLLAGWTQLAEFALSRADEARALLRH